MRLWLKIVIGIIVILFLAFLWKLTYPPALFPHERIVIGLPYRINDTPSGMIPMGETIYHPKPRVPHGHPGIDFGWMNSTSHDVVSSSDGVVTSIEQGASEPGKWDVEVTSGNYILRYKEMDDYNAAFDQDKNVKKGSLIGHVGNYCDNASDHPHCWFNLHWELASRSNILDRFCPVTYFDTDSRKTIEALWISVPDTDTVKSKFPDICSGDYYNKTE